MLYLDNLRTALIIFPILALALTVPVLIYHYHRYGALTLFRSLVIYSFIFYLLAAYCLIILPLPPQSVVAHLTTPKYNLMPLTFVREFINTTPLVLTNPHTYLATLKQAAVIQPLFNIVLTIPFGVYLRYFFKMDFKKTILLSFGLSLFFELTQLSGLYGIYPRPYWLFDVDDLLLNTTGGLIGFAVEPLLTFLLPTRTSLDESAYAHGQKVGYLRRLLALWLDYSLLAIISSLISFGWRISPLKNITIPSPVAYSVSVGLYFVLLPLLWSGQTPAKKLLNLQLISDHQSKWGLFARQFSLFFIIFPSFSLWRIALDAVVANGPTHLDRNLVLLGLTLILPVLALGNFLLSWLLRRPQLFYEKLTHTREISSLKKN